MRRIVGRLPAVNPWFPSFDSEQRQVQAVYTLFFVLPNESSQWMPYASQCCFACPLVLRAGAYLAYLKSILLLYNACLVQPPRSDVLDRTRTTSSRTSRRSSIGSSPETTTLKWGVPSVFSSATTCLRELRYLHDDCCRDTCH